MTTRTLADDVRFALPHIKQSSDPRDLQEASVDAYWKAIAFAEAGRPMLGDVVVQPAATAEVAEVVRFARERDTPLTTRGLGSGTQGGAVPDRGGIVLDLQRMNQIMELDEVSATVRVQAGRRGSELEEWLNERGWSFPHYPASIHLASVGGYLAAKGSGVLSTKYGKIEDLVGSIEVVLPNGEVIRTAAVPSHAMGPDLNQVFIGSEGTYGVITEVTLLLIRTPERRSFQVVSFPDVATGVEAVRHVLQQGWTPSLIRLFDPEATKYHVAAPLETSIEGTQLIIGFDGPAQLVETEHAVVIELLTKRGGVDGGSEIGEAWWKNRYKYYYPPYKPKLPQIWGTADVVASYSNIMPVYDALGQVLIDGFSDWNLRLTRHFSHWYTWGTMIYGRFHIDEPPSDLDEAAELYDRIWRRSSEVVLANGAVINDHHGVGLKLAADLPAQLGGSFEVLRGIKKALDPRGFMNPGKLSL